MDEFIGEFHKRYGRPFILGLVLIGIGFKMNEDYDALFFVAGGLLVGVPILITIMSVGLYFVLGFFEFLFGIGKSVYARREKIKSIFILIGLAIAGFLILSLFLFEMFFRMPF